MPDKARPDHQQYDVILVERGTGRDFHRTIAKNLRVADARALAAAEKQRGREVRILSVNTRNKWNHK